MTDTALPKNSATRSDGRIAKAYVSPVASIIMAHVLDPVVAADLASATPGDSIA